MTGSFRLQPGAAALLEVGILFLPAVPAYLWLWPNVAGETENFVTHTFVYLYVLAGTLWIGLRRWRFAELGLNRSGLGLSLVCGVFIIAGRTFIILAVDWEIEFRAFDLLRFAGDAFFYLGLVGVVEELLFRGLVYQALETWKGPRWAILGSSLGFLLWHIFGQGPLIGLTAFFYGLIFALIRRRAGGIVGLILVHGLMDLAGAALLPSVDVVGLGRPAIPHPGLLILGLASIVGVPLFLWLAYPRLAVRTAN